MPCRSLDGRGVWGRMDTCIYLAEFLYCPQETITTLLISYVYMLNCLSYVWVFVTLWTLAYQASSWDSPSKNTGVGCHAPLQGMFQPRDRTLVSYTSCVRQVDSLPLAPPGKPFPLTSHLKWTFQLKGKQSERACCQRHGDSREEAPGVRVQSAGDSPRFSRKPWAWVLMFSSRAEL